MPPMPQPPDSLGPILDLMSWVGFVPGIPLLIVGWMMKRRRCPWNRVSAEVFEAGGFTGLRWSDAGNAPHVSLHTADQVSGMEPGDEVIIHYDSCHPSRWSIDEPRHGNPVMILGGIFAFVGTLSTVGGFVLMAVSG